MEVQELLLKDSERGKNYEVVFVKGSSDESK